jgi:hypothetical protein
MSSDFKNLSIFGWTFMSRDAIGRAEAQLDGHSEGVRDEIGFLLIHQRYADRFFPGTSVLHTRLRYVLFVPWMYEALQRETRARSVQRSVERAEVHLAGRLLKAGEDGVIGARRYPEKSNQPPSLIYWTALGAWGLLGPTRDGEHLPTRSRIHASLSSATRTALDDDGVPLNPNYLPFDRLMPEAPDDFGGDGELTFVLLSEEKEYLRKRLSDVRSVHHPGEPSLLAKLALLNVVPDVDHCWNSDILKYAGKDRDALLRAGQAAALAAIGRGIYAALVEEIRECNDSIHTSRLHRDQLPMILAEHAEEASKLNLLGLQTDGIDLSEAFSAVLTETQDWIHKKNGTVMDLLDCYRRAECRRKGQRARLSRSLKGMELRRLWENDKHPEAKPLHYRWHNVHRLLRDLNGAA